MSSERNVVDDIDALIATELDEHGVPLDDYNADRYPRCELCQRHWHGLPYEDTGCPGAHASESDVEAWKAKQHKSFEDKSLSQYVCQIDGVTYRLELLGHASAYAGAMMATLLPESESGDSVQNFSGAYAFSEATATFLARAMPIQNDCGAYTIEEGNPPETGTIATGLDDL